MHFSLQLVADDADREHVGVGDDDGGRGDEEGHDGHASTKTNEN